MFEVGPGIWAGVLVEFVVRPGDGLGFEVVIVIGDVALAKIVTEVGCGVLAEVLNGVVIEVGFGC